MTGLYSLPSRMVRKRAPSTKPRQHPEQDLQIEVAANLSWMLDPEFGIYWTAVDHSYHGERRGAMLKRMGVKAGIPDVLIVFGGQFYGIELKSEDGTLTEAQKREHPIITRASRGKLAVCRSGEAVYNQIDAWGIPRLTVNPRYAIRPQRRSATAPERP